MKVAKECAVALASQAESVCRQLLPNGKVKGGRYYAGSINGEEGGSLVVELKGSRQGLWADFANPEGTGTSRGSGDLVDLWASVNGKPIREVLGDICRYCNMEVGAAGKPKQYKKPNLPKNRTELPDKVVNWFKDRGIEQQTLTDNYVRWIEGSADEEGSIVYPCMHKGKPSLLRYRKFNAPHNQRFKSSIESRPTLFGWPVIPDRARVLFLTEGFEDCMLLQQWGLPTLSVPFGAGGGNKQQWIEEEYDLLQQFDDIVLCMDADGAGEAAIKEICKRLGQHRCRIMRLGGMDVTDWWRAGGNKQRFIELAKAAKPLDMEVIKNLSAFTEEAAKIILGGGYSAIDKAFRFPFKDMEDWVIPDGQLACFTGFGGTGKSTYTNYLSLLAIKQGYRTLVASMEMAGRDTAVKYGLQATGRSTPTEEYLCKALDYVSDHVWVYDVLEKTKLDRLIEAMEYSARRYGTNLFIVDSLLKLGFSAKEPDELTEAINTLGVFAAKHQCQMWIIAHQIKPDEKFSKRTPRPSEYGIRGIGSAPDQLAYTYGVHKADIDPNPDSDKHHMPNMLLIPFKARLADRAPDTPVAFWFDHESQTYHRDSRKIKESIVPED